MSGSEMRADLLPVSDEAVQAKTGKVWSEWFTTLDAAGADKMSHKEIVSLLSQEHNVGPWWQQMITVTYEQVRGLREKHETATGYQISRSKTVARPVDVLYRAWVDQEIRRRWLPDARLSIRKATENRSLRLDWDEGQTRVDVYFYPKGEGKTQVTVQHNKLPDKAAAEEMKSYWSRQLHHLENLIAEG